MCKNDRSTKAYKSTHESPVHKQSAKVQVNLYSKTNSPEILMHTN